MKSLKKLLAVLSVFTVLTSLYACGKTDAENSNSESSLSDIALDSSAEKDLENSTDVISEPDKQTTEKNNTDKPVTTTMTSDKNSPTNPTTTSTKDSNKTSNNNASNNNTSNIDDNSPTNNDQDNNSNNTPAITTTTKTNKNPVTTTTTKANNTPAITTTKANNTPIETVTTEAVSIYTAEISFGNTPNVLGQNASVDGTVVNIFAGGDFFISGSTSEGQIIVNTTEKVKIFLDGVDISCSYGPAIQVNDAKKMTIELVDGTVSTLRDSGNDKINKGVIFSNDTLNFKGTGELNIISGNAHGIASDDDIIIQDGIYNITSIKSGMIANDDISIKGGTLNVFGGTNGIKSKGTINISGGYSVICGGTKEEKSSLYSASTFNYTGGTLFAIGNTVTAPESAIPYLVAVFDGTKAGGSSIDFYLNGAFSQNIIPANNYKCALVLSEQLVSGSNVDITVDGIAYNTVSLSGGQNLIELSK